METEKATIIVEGTFCDGYEENFNQYSQTIRDILVKHKSAVIRRQLIEETLYGTETPNLIMVIDFEDKQVARTIFLNLNTLPLFLCAIKFLKHLKCI